MSIRSAQAKLHELGSSRGYCVPLSIDAAMKGHDLPDEYYDFFAKPYFAGGDTDANPLYAQLIKDYFGYEPAPDTDNAHLAGYNAFGVSEQSYFPDAPYTYSQEDDELHRFKPEVTAKSKRLYMFLNQAATLGSTIMFSAPGRNGNAHAASLELIDGDSALYVVRDPAQSLMPNERRIYDTRELSGVTKDVGGYVDDFAPLPEFARPHYPSGKTSWELTVFPSGPTS